MATPSSTVPADQASLRALSSDRVALLARLADDLGAEARRLEPDFVRLTEGLVKVHECTGQIATLGSQLAVQIGERLEQIRADGIGALVDGSYSALQASLAVSTQRRDSLVVNTQALAALEQQGRRVRGIATRLGVTRLGFSIECTRLTQHESEFRDFVRELSGLERSVSQLGAELTQQADSAKCEQARLSEVIRLGLDELRRLSSRCERVAQSATSGIGAVLGGCGTLVNEVASTTQVIRTHSEELIYFLQFGDIVRQRLEHVAQALASSQTDPGVVARTVAVQVAQLEAIHEEIQAASGKLNLAFAGIGRTSNTLVESIADFSGAPSAANGNDHPTSLSALQSDIRNMHDLRQRAEQLGSSSNQAAAAAADVASRMGVHLDHVKEANARMHMMALNAIVNTSRLGQSAAALSVLSIQVHEVAKESAVIVAAVLPLLEQVRTGALITQEAYTTPESGQSQDAIERGLSNLGELTGWVDSKSRDMGALVATQRQALDEVRRHVGFLTGLRQRIAHNLGELRRTGHKLHAFDAGAIGPDAVGDLAMYTMESERDAHLRALGIAAQPEALAARANKSSASDLGDNVELF